jgi:hypothetical protein
MTERINTHASFFDLTFRYYRYHILSLPRKCVKSGKLLRGWMPKKHYEQTLIRIAKNIVLSDDNADNDGMESIRNKASELDVQYGKIKFGCFLWRRFSFASDLMQPDVFSSLSSLLVCALCAVLVVVGWWLLVGGWWLVVGGWWLVVVLLLSSSFFFLLLSSSFFFFLLLSSFFFFFLLLSSFFFFFLLSFFFFLLSFFFFLLLLSSSFVQLRAFPQVARI